ncbi:hypothetical protein [Neptunomonas marina]|uniref:DUF8082 domain-containing protein n=1 Tax=Neptunomonas marina TaxID=1815562 RepID=A0A437QBL1_9GAMM|nr:hypothetical protein [Neptunomonas marina]RVU31789.1 hypothetical protein EOE65_07365 [Neptunomonas marina]
MEKILKDLELLGGIHHSCLFKEDAVDASTFPSILDENIAGACRVIRQIFMAVEGMDLDHREVFLELDENLLIGYAINSDVLLLMMTDKDVNLALINTSIRSAVPKIRKQLTPDAVEETPATAPDKAAAKPKRPGRPWHEAELLGVMDQLREGLAVYIGPAASIVFDDAYDQWYSEHGAQKSKVAELIKVLATEIDDKSERSQFLQNAVNIVRASAQQGAR